MRNYPKIQNEFQVRIPGNENEIVQGSRKGWNRNGAQEFLLCSAVVGAFLFFCVFRQFVS